MYDNLSFSVPESARKHFKYQPAAPGFNYLSKNDFPPINEVDQWIEEYENGPFWQDHMQQYYGMVKCIDDNIGKLMNTDEHHRKPIENNWKLMNTCENR